MVESNSNRKLKVYRARMDAILEQHPELFDLAVDVFNMWEESRRCKSANLNLDGLQEFLDYLYLGVRPCSVSDFDDPELVVHFINIVTEFICCSNIPKYFYGGEMFILLLEHLSASYPLSTSDTQYNDLIDSAFDTFELRAGCCIYTTVSHDGFDRYILVHYTFENAIDYDYLCDLALQLKEDIIDAYNQCYGD